MVNKKQIPRRSVQKKKMHRRSVQKKMPRRSVRGTWWWGTQRMCSCLYIFFFLSLLWLTKNKCSGGVCAGCGDGGHKECARVYKQHTGAQTWFQTAARPPRIYPHVPARFFFFFFFLLPLQGRRGSIPMSPRGLFFLILFYWTFEIFIFIVQLFLWIFFPFQAAGGCRH